MAVGGLHRCRRVAGAIALAGMAFYAVLFPWHTVSQAVAQLLPSKLEKSLKPNCHDSGSASDEGSKSPAPAKPLWQCPICKGCAALQLALVCAANTVFIRPEASASAPRIVEDDLTAQLVRAPQNRGPPLQLA
jgi:hypothetical protein